jgi:arylsulfatase A-like enzyme
MSKTRPNILFFFTDDQRYDTIHALGCALIHTPNIDRLVESGVSFSHAHIPGGTVAAVCMPSRGMLHTGRTLFHLQGAGEEIPPEHTLLGEHLQRHGYRTYGTGKWHNGPAAYARGFSAGAEIFYGGMQDHWNVPACHFDPSGKYDLYKPAVRDPWSGNQTQLRPCDHIVVGKHSTELFADAAIDYLRGYQADDPFFLYLSFMAPHDPRTMPRQYLDLYDPAQIALPGNLMPEHPFDNGELRVRDELLAAFPREPQEIRRHIAEYYAMISHLDDAIGRVMAELERRGMAENTIILLAGDNGLALGQHGLMGKQSNYEHSVRVPLVIAGPGIPRNQRSEALVYLLDIFPTLCELTGLPTPPSVDGRSLVPAWREPQATIRETLYLAYGAVQRSVRDRCHKLIEYVVEGRRTTQLFDLERDPLELRNLAGDPGHRAKLEELRARMFALRDEWGDRQSEWGAEFWDGFGN